MDAHTALLTRRSPHRFVPEVMDQAVLDRALEAAHQAPCHRRSWPWRFTAVGLETRHKLADLLIRSGLEAGGIEAVLQAEAERKILRPSALLVISQVLDDDAHRAREDYAACAAATQNLLLSLHADGWSGKWGTGKLTRHPEALQLLHIDASRESVVAFVWVGRCPDPLPVPRPPLSHVCRSLP